MTADVQDARNFQSAFVKFKYGLQKNFSRYKSFMKKHQTLAAVVGVVTSFYAVPVTVYMAFSIIAFLLTFIGFLIILGGILFVGFLVLASVLSTITIVVFFVAFIAYILFAMYQQFYLLSERGAISDTTTQPDHKFKEEPST